MASREADDCLRRIIHLSGLMIELAHAGDACREDTGCGIVFGALRDNAYKVRKMAELELREHTERARSRAVAGPVERARAAAVEKDPADTGAGPEYQENHEHETQDPDRG